jgi:AraC family transcriptional regulator
VTGYPEQRAGAFRIRDHHYGAARTQARHAHEEVQLSILLRGSMIEDVRGQSYGGRAGDIVVKPAGIAHANTFDGTRIVCVHGAAELIGAAVPRYAWHRVDGAMRAGFHVARRFADGVVSEDDVYELLGALDAPAVADRAIANRAAEMLDAAATQRVSLARVARELHVHPVYLARVFRQRWQCTPREYLQRVRVRAAVALITANEQPLAEIAFTLGFSDQAHMTRMVGRITGLTPAALRRLAG